MGFRFLIIAFLAVFCGAASADTSWRFHSLLPPGDSVYQLHKDFVSTVEKETQGRVKIELFGAGQLPYKPFDAVMTVGTNKVQMADSAFIMVAGTVPELNVLGLPFLATTFDEALSALEVISPTIDRELGKRFDRVGIFTHYFFPPQKAWLRKPARTIDDLKGLKVRTKGPDEANMVKRLGAIPVTMAQEEVPSALQLGTLDGALTSAPTVRDAKWETLTPHALALNFSLGHLAIFYNAEEFRKLPPAVQAALRDKAAAHGLRLRRAMAEIDTGAQRTLEQRGVKIVTLSAADIERSRKHMAPMWDEWATKNGAVAQKLLSDVRARLGR